MSNSIFRTSVGESVFNYKYRHEGADTWEELACSITEDVCKDYLPIEEKQEIAKMIANMEFIPGGRYLYYAARPLHAWNNCFGKETNVLTDLGWRSVSEVGLANVISPVDGKAYPAQFISRGMQKVNKITFAAKQGHQTHKWEVRATRSHHWLLKNGEDTYDLRVGDVIPAGIHEPVIDPLGFAHGFVFGDGNRKGDLRLCADKDKKYLDLLQTVGTVTYPSFANGDPVLHFHQKEDWKNVPVAAKGKDYIASFIKGWIAADGCETNPSHKLCSVNEAALKWFRKHAAYAGIVITGNLRSQIRDTKIADYEYKDHKIYVQNYNYSKNFAGFKVVSIEEDGEEEVFCPYEPVHSRLIIDHCIDTFNCFLLSAETDTREDWANLSWKAESCLALGGGIGIDYSKYRPRGAPLKRTGGFASGPVSKMKMINEIGREVMQGGSRRCLPGNSQVLLPDGSTKDIKDIQPGDMVATRNGSRKVLATENAGIKPLIKITTSRGSVISSEDHKWLSCKADRRIFFQRARNFSLNSKLYKCNVPLRGGETFDVDKSYVYGYFMGDGCAYSSGRTHEITFQIANKWYSKDQVNKITKVMQDHGHVIEGKGHGDCTELRYRSKESLPFFQTLKAPHQAPCTPDYIKNGCVETRAAYLAGWWDADGCYTSDAWKICNFHESARKEIQFLLNTLGIESTVSGNEVRISSFQSQLFLDTVGKYTYKKPSKLPYRKQSIIPTDVIGIEQLPAETVYDIQVEGEEFIADGFVSHNSAIYASLNWQHQDAKELLLVKNWSQVDVKGTDGKTLADLKQADFNFPAPLDMTNISLNYDNAFLESLVSDAEVAYREKRSKLDLSGVVLPELFVQNVRQALKDGEPGFSFNFYEKEKETLRNACCEVTSEDDSDVCNLASVNLSRIYSLNRFKEVVSLATKFLVCGTLGADLPYKKVYSIREKNRRLGLGLMGVHEWLLKKNYRYEMNDELRAWLTVYRDESEKSGTELANKLSISVPVAFRAIAPTGSIGMLAGTTTGIEPLYAVAYKRRYLKGKDNWMHQYVIDGTAKYLIDSYDVEPESIESAVDLEANYERRIAFQADVQDYVDMAISSTINLGAYDTAYNHDDMVMDFARTLASYSHRLRGFTCYPDGSRGGQPLEGVDYYYALSKEGVEFTEHDVCSIHGGGTCGA